MFIYVTQLHRRISPTKSNCKGVTTKRNNPLQVLHPELIQVSKGTV